MSQPFQRCLARSVETGNVGVGEGRGGGGFGGGGGGLTLIVNRKKEPEIQTIQIP